MRIARDFGTVSELLPDGISDMRDMPHHLFGAVRRALLFLSFEELPDDERPERHLWLDDEALEDHFKAVKRLRAAKYGTADRAPIEDPVANDAAGLLIHG